MVDRSRKIRFDTHIRKSFASCITVEEVDLKFEELYSKFDKTEEGQDVIIDFFLKRKEKLMNNKDKEYKWLDHKALELRAIEENKLLNDINLCTKIQECNYIPRPYKKRKKKEKNI